MNKILTLLTAFLLLPLAFAGNPITEKMSILRIDGEPSKDFKMRRIALYKAGKIKAHEVTPLLHLKFYDNKEFKGKPILEFSNAGLFDKGKKVCTIYSDTEEPYFYLRSALGGGVAVSGAIVGTLFAAPPVGIAALAAFYLGYATVATTAGVAIGVGTASCLGL